MASNSFLKARHGSDHDGAHDRVLLDGLVFFLGQRARLSQDAVGNADFADIMQQGGDLNHVLQSRLRSSPSSRAICEAVAS